MTTSQKYYMIVSRMHGMVLDVQGASAAEGTPVITWHKTGKDNQLWYDDPSTATIRTKLNSYCLDVEDECLIIKSFKAGVESQRWQRDADGYIRQVHDRNKVIDIFALNREPGAKVGLYEKNDGVNQQWQYEYINDGPAPPDHRRLFHIVSDMNNKVIDIKSASCEPGAEAVMWSKADPPTMSQLWFIDYREIIHSALTGFVFRAKETGDSVEMVPYTGAINENWKLADNRKIWNEGGTGECLDIRREDKHDGARIISYHYKGSSNQHWTFNFV